MRLALDELMMMPLTATMKGMPHDGAGISLAEVKGKQWNILQEHVPLPCAVIKRSMLEHNAAWMQQFTQEENVQIAPHGKTTMAPQLFDLQFAHGAWGLTVATVQQLKVCRTYGIKRIIMANQLVGMNDIRYIVEELSHDETFEFYCLVDCIDGAERLQRSIKKLAPNIRLRVLVEVGFQGGRTGCRTAGDTVKVATYIMEQSCLELHGVECYEGLFNIDNKQDIDQLIATVEQAYQLCRLLKLFADPNKVLLSAGGSAYFDIVAPLLSQVKNTSAITAVLRSGCYLTHDSLFYARHFKELQKRCVDKAYCRDGLQAALEVWVYVQSIPEPGLAILTVGKRDISHDIDLPVVEKWYQPWRMCKPESMAGEVEIVALNDQHAYLKYSTESDIKIGDMLALGISHPCTTFDKWQLLWLVDDDYQVIDGIRTFF